MAVGLIAITQNRLTKTFKIARQNSSKTPNENFQNSPMEVEFFVKSLIFVQFTAFRLLWTI